MKGKRANIAFVSEFMSKCVEKGMDSPELILGEAKKQLIEIEEKIEEAEKLKFVRSGILDVIESFEKKAKGISEKADKLDLFSIEKPEICRMICDFLKIGPVAMSSLNSTQNDVQDLIFCVKQLIQFRVIGKTGDVLLRGDRFDDYVRLMEGKL